MNIISHVESQLGKKDVLHSIMEKYIFSKNNTRVFLDFGIESNYLYTEISFVHLLLLFFHANISFSLSLPLFCSSHTHPRSSCTILNVHDFSIAILSRPVYIL